MQDQTDQRPKSQHQLSQAQFNIRGDLQAQSVQMVARQVDPSDKRSDSLEEMEDDF